MMHWFVTKKNWKGRKDMRRVKAEKEEMPIFLAKNVTAKGLNLHVGERPYGIPPSRNPTLMYTDGMRTRGYG